MNERIKDLKKQSYITFKDENSFECLVFSKEKFAELIVRECCQYLESEAERLHGLAAKEDDEIYQANFEICAEKCYDNSQGLKDHFGVR